MLTFYTPLVPPTILAPLLPTGDPTKPTILSHHRTRKSKRAEQNRKAQQAFRRRREEKMKELEIKAKEMERLNRAIEDGLRRVGEAGVVSPASISGKGESVEGKAVKC